MQNAAIPNNITMTAVAVLAKNVLLDKIWHNLLRIGGSNRQGRGFISLQGPKCVTRALQWGVGRTHNVGADSDADGSRRDRDTRKSMHGEDSGPEYGDRVLVLPGHARE